MSGGSAAPQRVLILKPCCIGDVLLATPLAASLAEAWPSARLEWAVGDHSRPVLVGHPALDAVVPARGCLRGDLRPLAMLRTALRLRRRRYDLVVVPDRSPILAWLARATGAPRRVGLDVGGRGRAHSHRVPARAADPRHESEIYLDLARALDLPVPGRRPCFVPSSTDERAAERALRVGTDEGERGAVQAHQDVAGRAHSEGRGVATGRADVEAREDPEEPEDPEQPEAAAPRPPRVVVHPGGGENPGMRMPSKRWPAERFGAVAARLVARGTQVVVVAGPGEAPLAAAVHATARAAAPDAPGAWLDLSEQLSLGATAAVIARSDLYLGNDSGVAHLAAAVGTPAVVVFGPTSPARYGPLPGAGRAVAPEPAAAPGPLRPGAGPSIDRVGVDDVWTAVQDELRASRGAGGT